MKARLVCKTCGGVKLLLKRREDDTPLVVPCPDCGAGAGRDEPASRGPYKKREGYRCIRLPFADMKHTSWCGRETRNEKVFWSIDHATIETLTCTGEVACAQCLAAIKATLRQRA